MFGWGPAILDPHDAVNRAFRSSSNLNYSHFNNPQLDDLLDKGLSTEEPGARKKIYSDVERLLNQTAAVVPINYAMEFWAITKRVKGLNVISLSYVDASYAWLQ
jgi:peptide/nickel transport system substrate-binding protein